MSIEELKNLIEKEIEESENDYEEMIKNFAYYEKLYHKQGYIRGLIYSLQLIEDLKE